MYGHNTVSLGSRLAHRAGIAKPGRGSRVLRAGEAAWSSGDTIPNCWANSGKSGRERVLRLMPIRQAPGATGVERLRPRANGQQSGGGERRERIDLSAGIVHPVTYYKEEDQSA